MEEQTTLDTELDIESEDGEWDSDLDSDVEGNLDSMVNGNCVDAQQPAEDCIGTSSTTDPTVTTTNVPTTSDPTTDATNVPKHIEKKKLVLKKRDTDYFEVLPEGWIEVTHYSGMPIYLHKASRVCSMSKPYYLGPGSTRKHRIPVSAIPCLSYRKERDKEQRAEPATVRMESVAQSKKENSLNWSAMREYCSKVFEFQEVTIRKFKTWKDRRAHILARKLQDRPSLPEDTRLITCPLVQGVGRNYKRGEVDQSAD